MEIFDLIYKGANIIIIAISAYLILITLRKTQEWNRRKTTHEFLNDLIFKEYTALSKVITYDLAIDVKDSTKSYEDWIYTLKPEDKLLLDYTLAKIYNIFEILAISIKNNIIDEDISYDFLGLMYTGYYKWGLNLIREVRKGNADDRTYRNFQECALKWQERMASEIKVSNVRAKGRL